jgi:hypothetical protein
MRNLAGVVAALMLVCALPAAAYAAAPVFSAPVAVGASSIDPQTTGGGFPPSVVLGPDGLATVAWLGGSDTHRAVLVSERLPGGGAFSRPLALSDDSRGFVLARDDAGVRAIAWADGSVPDGSPKLSIAPPRVGFGSPEDVPIAPRSPATQSNLSEPTRYISVSSLAVAPDGAVLVAYVDQDSRADNQRAVVVLRRPDGRWTEPQVLEEHLQTHGPVVAADGVGGLHALWPAPPHDGSTQRMRLLYTADAGPDGHFGAERVLSEPDRDADNGSAEPKLLANRRGDLLVVWEAEVYGPVIEATSRTFGGDWSPPEVIYEGTPFGRRPTGALDDRGDALVSWTNGNAYARSRPAGADWGPVSTAFARQGTIDQIPTALDTQGTGLLVSAVARSVGTVDTIAAFVLPRGRTLGHAITVSGGEEPVSRPQIATDAFGNGLAVWLRGPVGQPSTVFAAGYSAGPPDVTSFQARKSAFGLRVNEPARVTITVRGSHGRASEWSRVQPGDNTLSFRGTVRSLLRHHGRYRATVRARDAGPRASRAHTITFKR